MIAVCIIIVLNITLISSSVLIGNISGDIDAIYAPSAIVRGWINISLLNEPVSSLLSVFVKDMKIIDFIKNNADINNYNCTPSDCNDNYEASSGEANKNFQLNFGQNKTLGLKFSGVLGNEPVSQFSFKIESNSPASCYQALKIDLGDDSDLDWIPITGTNDFDCSRPVTCFNYSETLSDRRIDDKAFCEKITVPLLSKFKVGASITKGTTPSPGLKMIVYNKDMEKFSNGECSLNVISSGETTCEVNLGLLNYTEIIVCIKADMLTDYTIKSESTSPKCGFYDIENHNDYNVDYPIFIQGGKYQAIGSFDFNEAAFRNYEETKTIELKDYVNQYLSDKFNNNCQNSCVIPIRLYSMEDQEIKLSNLSLVYSTDTGPLSENKFYEITSTSAKISSGYMKLGLEKGNFSVPGEQGNRTLVIRLQGNEIFRKDIVIKIIPTISSVTPTEVSAGIPARFSIQINFSSANMTYKWNFGDNSSEEISNNKTIMHTYQKIGTYQLKIKAVSKTGESENTFTINAVSPKSRINQTIADYRKDMKSFEDQVNKLSSFTKSNILNKTRINDIRENINLIEKNYKEGFIDDEKAIEIIKELMDLKIPYKVYNVQAISSSLFYLGTDEIDLAVLDDIGAGALNEEKTREDYIKAINKWLINNLDIKIDSNTYSVSYRDKDDEIIGSIVKLNLEPKEKINKLFLVINGNRDEINMNENYKVFSSSVSDVRIEIDEFEQSKTVEFFYPEKIELANLPLYVSPLFNELSLGPSIVIKCNSNKICEKESGENYDNCSDCPKPWLLKSMIIIFIVLIIAFIIYIILQEWYKRHYEKSLFKNKNELFNLVNFMQTNEKQGFSKDDIFKKLQEAKWRNEQLKYAWNKLHGKRTGMFEIPIFIGSENKEVRKEMETRKGFINRRPV